MTRRRVTDRATGEHVVDVDVAETADHASQAGRRTLGPADRATVLPAATPPTARDRYGVEVVVDGWRFELEVEDADRHDLRQRATSGREADAHHGPTDVRAIIPGRVVSVAVVVGDEVAAGQRLLSVEAMKMENELRAPRAGTVDRISVAAGQTVELGDTLVVLR